MSKKSNPKAVAGPLPYNCSFADIIAPITEEEFFRDYFGKKYLHIPGAVDKFKNVMTWDILSGLLNMHAIWSSNSLMLATDRKVLPAHAYCKPGIDHSGNDVMMPVPELVKKHIMNGATLVCNDIDTLNPGLMGICNALEKAVNGKSQANLYCSSRQRQAFSSHYDTHDVFAMHMEGEKVWRVFETLEDFPIRHKAYIKPADAQLRDRGKSHVEITLKPGDFLYIPRGMYHDALSSTEGCIHIAFGLTGYIGMDVLSNISGALVHDPYFRKNLPRHQQGKEALKSYMQEAAKRISDTITSDAFVNAIYDEVENYHYERGIYELPIKAEEITFKTTTEDLSVAVMNGQPVLKNKTQGVPLPPHLVEQVKWVLDQKEFNRNDFTEKFAATGIEVLDKTLTDLMNMKVISQIS